MNFFKGNNMQLTSIHSILAFVIIFTMKAAFVKVTKFPCFQNQ